MVAHHTQVSPLKHHIQGSDTRTSFRKYSRIQSEVQREGSEIHKENLLSLSLSKNGKHFGAGGKTDTTASSGSQQGGHGRMMQASEAALPMVFSMEMGQGRDAQDHGNDMYHMVSRVSKDVGHLVAAGTAENPGMVQPVLTSMDLQSLATGAEALNTYNLCAEKFPQASTFICTCPLLTSTHKEKEAIVAEGMKPVQFLSDARTVEDDQEDYIKHLKFFSTMDATPSESFDVQSPKHRNASGYATNGSKVSTAIEWRTQGGMGEICPLTCTYKRGHRAAYSACARSLPEDTLKSLSAAGLRPFTATAHAQMPKAMLTFSEGEPSIPFSLESSQQRASKPLQKIQLHDSTCTDADWGKFLALSATPSANDMQTFSKAALPFQNRFKHLQAFLKQCDETDQNECIQALRSLSAAARSGHAVELETRAIRLSLEEGKEIKRMKVLNVLGKISERSLDDAGATPHGPRLPAPGATAKPKSVT